MSETVEPASAENNAGDGHSGSAQRSVMQRSDGALTARKLVSPLRGRPLSQVVPSRRRARAKAIRQALLLLRQRAMFPGFRITRKSYYITY